MQPSFQIAAVRSLVAFPAQPSRPDGLSSLSERQYSRRRWLFRGDHPLLALHSCLLCSVGGSGSVLPIRWSNHVGGRWGRLFGSERRVVLDAPDRTGWFVIDSGQDCIPPNGLSIHDGAGLELAVGNPDLHCCTFASCRRHASVRASPAAARFSHSRAPSRRRLECDDDRRRDIVVRVAGPSRDG